VLFPIILATLFHAWLERGLDEDRRQQAAIEEWDAVGIFAHTDADPCYWDVPQSWSGKWLYATPWWNSRRWLAAMSRAERRFGTVVDVDFYQGPEISDADWERICTSFASARSVRVWCPVKDDQLRSLTRMRNLAELWIFNADDVPFVGGEGLRHLKGTRSLRCLALNGVRLNDAGRKALADLQYLVEFRMLGEADDDILASVSQLKRLECINLSDTRITDAGLSHLRKVPSLLSVSIDGAGITDGGLRHLAGLKLRALYLAGTAVTDRGVVYLTGMHELNELNLGDTDVTDAAIPSLLKLKKLEFLGLSDTRVSAAGCRKLIASLPDLRILITADGEWIMRDSATGRWPSLRTDAPATKFDDVKTMRATAPGGPGFPTGP
jgi:hypothetical protein